MASLEEFRDRIEALSRNMPNILKKVLLRGGALIREEIVLRHLSGPKMPRGVGDPENATLQPQSGDLRGSIRYEARVESDRVGLVLYTNVEYARKHEEGRGVPKRPFMKPSLNKKKKEAIDFIRENVMEALRGRG